MRASTPRTSSVIATSACGWISKSAKPLAPPAAPVQPGPERGHQPRHEAERQPAVSDLGCQLHVRLGAGAEPDRQAWVHVQDRRERLADAERAGPRIRQRDLAAGVSDRVL